jgi:hypothetical protein
MLNNNWRSLSTEEKKNFLDREMDEYWGKKSYRSRDLHK